MPRGGYQKPTNGAVVSPPGALSKRKAVERNASQSVAPGGAYGSRKATEQQLSAAPIAKAPATPSSLAVNVSPDVAAREQISPLTAETQRPEEPITNGMSFGEGLRPMDIGLPPGTGQGETEQMQDLRKLATYLPIIETVANSEDAPATLRTFVKHLRSL